MLRAGTAEKGPGDECGDGEHDAKRKQQEHDGMRRRAQSNHRGKPGQENQREYGERDHPFILSPH